MRVDGGGQIDEGVGFRSVLRWDSDLDVGGSPDGGEQVATGRLFSKPADPVDFVARAGGGELRWLLVPTAQGDRWITPCGGVTPGSTSRRFPSSTVAGKSAISAVQTPSDSPVGPGQALTRQLSRP